MNFVLVELRKNPKIILNNYFTILLNYSLFLGILPFNFI